MILLCDFKQIESFDSYLKKDWILKSTALKMTKNVPFIQETDLKNLEKF